MKISFLAFWFSGSGGLPARAPTYQGVRISAPQPPEWKYILTAFLKGKGKDGATIKEIHEALERAENDYASTKTQLTRMTNNGEIIKLRRGIYTLPDSQLPMTTDIKLTENIQLEFGDEEK